MPLGSEGQSGNFPVGQCLDIASKKLYLQKNKIYNLKVMKYWTILLRLAKT